MEIITREEVRLRREEIKHRILKGEIYIHPTDTIYGLGCNAKLQSSVDKIRELKGRPKAPFSVIAPSIDWIYQNCEVTEEGEKWIKRLPGPYTLIFKCTNKACVANAITLEIDTIGVRIPNHWFTGIVQELGIPTVTTSANLVGKQFMTSMDNLDNEIKKGVQFALYEGDKKGNPSTIIDLTQKKRFVGIPIGGPKVTKRKK
jgi:L-threonylcarbamoyladenylate synthase